jgi:hypothetical protein
MQPPTITTNEFNTHKDWRSGPARDLAGSWTPGAGWDVEVSQCANCGLMVRTWDKNPPGHDSPIIQVEPAEQAHVHEPCARRGALLWCDSLKAAPNDRAFAEAWKLGFSDSLWEKLGYLNADEMCRHELGFSFQKALERVALGELGAPFAE